HKDNVCHSEDNFEARDYIDLIDWQTTKITTPPIMNDVTDEEITRSIKNKSWYISPPFLAIPRRWKDVSEQSRRSTITEYPSRFALPHSPRFTKNIKVQNVLRFSINSRQAVFNTVYSVRCLRVKGSFQVMPKLSRRRYNLARATSNFMLECNKDVPKSSTKFSYMLSMSLTQFSPSDCSNENQDLSHSFDINDLNFDTTQEQTLQNPKFDDNPHNEHVQLDLQLTRTTLNSLLKILKSNTNTLKFIKDYIFLSLCRSCLIIFPSTPIKNTEDGMKRWLRRAKKRVNRTYESKEHYC
ncbi:hypothetical protein NQ317_005477, partial [Molorchus minor]